MLGRSPIFHQRSCISEFILKTTVSGSSLEHSPRLASYRAGSRPAILSVCFLGSSFVCAFGRGFCSKRGDYWKGNRRSADGRLSVLASTTCRARMNSCDSRFSLLSWRPSTTEPPLLCLLTMLSCLTVQIMSGMNNLTIPATGIYQRTCRAISTQIDRTGAVASLRLTRDL